MLKLENQEQKKKPKIGDYVRYTQKDRKVTRDVKIICEGIVDSELFEKYIEICFVTKDGSPSTYWCDLENGSIEIL